MYESVKEINHVYHNVIDVVVYESYLHSIYSCSWMKSTGVISFSKSDSVAILSVLSLSAWEMRTEKVNMHNKYMNVLYNY